MYKGVEMQKNKKQFYITELHLGDDGLESYTDCSGPFTLVKARRIMEKIFNARSYSNFYNMAIRGPRHNNSKGLPTEFYQPREDK
tara:strand:- start:126 stop:380 length:255 start_codon:yes stop_codon:yes gene_type:complete